MNERKDAILKIIDAENKVSEGTTDNPAFYCGVAFALKDFFNITDKEIKDAVYTEGEKDGN